MRYALLLAGVLAVGCSSIPTSPTAAPVQVVQPPQPPSIQGQWSGPYNVSSCTTTGTATGSGFCPSLGSGGGMVFTPQQSGSQVTGTLTIGAFEIHAQGTVDTAGIVVLSGSANLFAGAVLTIQTWRGTVSGSNLPGSYQYTIADSGGSATVIGTFALTK